VNPLEPSPTPLDLKWRLFGIHFRVHPSFWGVALIFGLVGAPRDRLLSYVFAWVVCMFLSVLVHELGHVIMGRIFGESGNILLCSFGGYATGSYDHLQRWQRIMVSFAGPAAGFLFLFAIIHVDNRYWNSFAADLFDENRIGKTVREFLHLKVPQVNL